MREKEPFSKEELIRCLDTYYGIKVTSLILLPIGADTNARIYKGETPAKASFFIKLKTNSPQDISVEIIELLHEAGIQEVILPIKTMDSQLTLRVENVTLIVYPFVEGQDGFHRDLTDNQWIKLGKTLRQIHEVDVPHTIQTHIRKENYSPKWREKVRSLYKQMDDVPKGDAIARNLWKFMIENESIIQRLVERAEKLCQKIKDQPTEYVLCHSDIHGGNILLSENDIFYIVDWDEPILAPKERDLMFIGGGVANVWNKPHEVELFYQGYGKTEVNGDILSYYRHERILEDIAIYCQEIFWPTTAGKKRSEMFTQFIEMFEPHGVVEIALKTYEHF